MRHQALRPAALMLSVLLVASTPAKAGTIEYADTAQAASDGRHARPASELRLRVMSQSGQLAPGTQAAPQSGATSSQDQLSGTNQPGTTTPSSDATLTQSSGGQIETVDLGDVTGTVCDCGEIPIVHKLGGFPMWPFLALAGIPLAFIPHGGNTPQGTPPNTPLQTSLNPPPQTPIPEPATLFLFGSGLLALGSNARRRRRARQLVAHAAVVTAAGEV